MKTLNIYYKDESLLVDFINLNKINNNSEILVQIFTLSSDLSFIKKLQNIINKHIKNAKVIGTSSDGIFGEESLKESSTLISISIFEKTKINTKIIKDENNNSFFIGQKIAKDLLVKNSKLLITFTDGLNTNGEEYLNGITSVNKNIIVSGGIAGDNNKFEKTYIFDNKNVFSKGAIAAVLNNKNLNILTDYSFDWLPVGVKMQVTKSVKNRVYEVNNEKIIKLYSQYLGFKESDNIPYLASDFPLVIERDNMLVGRTVLKKFNDGSLLFSGNIDKGEFLRFGVANSSLIMKKRKKVINLLKARKPESVFVYASSGRRHFKPETTNEDSQLLSLITNTSGFFTHGEFFHKKSKNYLLSETLTILAISEKEFSNEEINKTKFKKTLPSTLETTATLANRVSNDFENIINERIKELKNTYHNDKLTNLYNRSQLITDLKEAKETTLTLLNINNFRGLNSFYGGDAGDFILKELSSKIVEITKNKNCRIYRLNADEFAILRSDKFEKDDLMTWVKYLLSTIGSVKFLYKKTPIHIDLTMGITSEENSAPLAHADIALKIAKKGKLPYFIYSNEINFTEEYAKNIEMAVKIKNSLKNDKIIPYYQPIIDNKTGKIVKYEALVRLIDENERVISPFFFLEISKKIRLYDDITKSVIRHAFKKFHNSEFEFSINLSVEDIENEEIIEYIIKYLDKYNVADKLIFEIVETEEVKNYDNLMKFVKKVKKMGIRIAIDDFGSGYSNLNYIVKIDADIVKIDGSLIKNIETDKSSVIVAEMIVAFAHKMNMETLAEFVENENIFNIVKSLGIDYSQGYYFSPPIKESDIP